MHLTLRKSQSATGRHKPLVKTNNKTQLVGKKGCGKFSDHILKNLQSVVLSDGRRVFSTAWEQLSRRLHHPCYAALLFSRLLETTTVLSCRLKKESWPILAAVQCTFASATEDWDKRSEALRCTCCGSEACRRWCEWKGRYQPWPDSKGQFQGSEAFPP